MISQHVHRNRRSTFEHWQSLPFQQLQQHGCKRDAQQMIAELIDSLQTCKYVSMLRKGIAVNDTYDSAQLHQCWS